MPTTTEWARFKRYARRMRQLKMKLSEEPIPSDTLSVLQLRILDESLLPNLKTLELKQAAANIIPFIPLFLSHGTDDIDIHFLTDPPAVMIASMIINVSQYAENLSPALTGRFDYHKRHFRDGPHLQLGHSAVFPSGFISKRLDCFFTFSRFFGTFLGLIFPRWLSLLISTYYFSRAF